ncbi:hypothetical protein G7Y89_g9343 [Cudoniella acicularis]|uniref:F-box domain-containing protein n=1 Tax=Cudoniella acicularis TaxID=354080 RepID=A0A8H4RHH3_9HELO|nr:hypothetical protein G7Y89_g9343 [Cudoniella acicularis]
MINIPNEILAEICSFSNNTTLKQLRLVNRILGQLTAEYLFREVDLILLSESIIKDLFNSFHNLASLYVAGLSRVEDHKFNSNSVYHRMAKMVLLKPEDAFTEIHEPQTPRLSCHASILSALENSGKHLRVLELDNVPDVFWNGTKANPFFLNAIQPCYKVDHF